MNKINWEVRLKSKTFWLAIVPAVILIVQTVGATFGYKWDFVFLNQQLASIINEVFAILALIGVVTDHTTQGIGDSDRVLNRNETERKE